MTAFPAHTPNGFAIRPRPGDGYFDGTLMCKANGKLIADYLRLDSTKAYLAALSCNMGIPISLLIETRKGNTKKYEQGTWVHPQVAIHLGQWCNPEFAVWVTNLVFDWLQGQQPLSRKALADDLAEDICQLGGHLERAQGTIHALNEAVDFGMFSDVADILQARIDKAYKIAKAILSA
ncbi:KilA-N domain-containing protein [Pseudanabaena sp. PCC 6802]|uniref:KilA-N domain-containing protein n=1 Tax=Pseudanabaena sp. PCC 6802 TaxID=118173 RepID=UPI0003717C79|nr:KilA-N domain-containing protein [Pseudanabaena sp. PCC 6802]